MSDFNNDEYLKGQVKKQVTQMKKTSYKVELEVLESQTDLDLKDETLKSLQDKVRDGDLTYEAITSYYLQKIYENRELNAVICINPEALEEAKSRSYHKTNTLIYGMPVLVKDNIGTSQMPTTAGAAVLKGTVCDEAEVVKTLKEYGAIILGKTNLSEWANFMSTESSNGYSALGGQTLNPYGKFDVGGSSSGSAVAVSCQLAPIAIGTETAGSIIYPASQNSVVGLKPTLGLIPQKNIIPISKSHDTAGPMARTVRDTYELLKSMTRIHLKKAVFTEKAFKNKTVGLIVNDQVTTYYRDGDKEILENASVIMKKLGAYVKPLKLDKTAFDTKVYEILKYEFREGVKTFLEPLDIEVKNLGDVIAFNEHDLDNLAPYNQEIIKQAYQEYFDPQVISDQIGMNRSLTRRSLDAALKEVDVLLTLSNYCTSVYAPAGYPAICIPAGYRESGEPIGITLIGSAHDDIKLLEFAYAFEQCIQRKNPRRPK